ncbi:MAG: hypothetical protein ACPLQO_06870 [Desulfotomaculales bacterium]
MSWEAIKVFFEKHRKFFMGMVFSLIVASWLLSQVVQELVSFETSVSLTTTAILLFVFFILDYLVYMKNPQDAEIYEKEHEATEQIKKYIEEERPKDVKMLEYSSATVGYIFESLKKLPGCNVKLLICHPEAAISDFQRKDRICSQIKRLPAVLQGGHGSFAVRCYRQPASLRGRNFDDQLVVVGWYTYDVKDEHRQSYGTSQIWGDSNPLIVSLAKTKQGSRLKKMFNEVFDSMWRDGVPLAEVCLSCRERNAIPGCPPDEWLKKVSGGG